MSRPACDVCGRGVETGVLYRANPVGEVPVVWRHRDCGERPLAARDPATVEVAELLQGGAHKLGEEGTR